MPKNWKRKRGFRQAAMDSNMKRSNAELSIHISNNVKTCRQCGKILTYFNLKPDGICQICRRLDRRRWEKGLSSAPFMSQPQHNEIFNREIKNEPVYQNIPQVTESWERRIYATPRRKAQGFNIHNNNESFERSSKISRTVSFKSDNDNQTNSVSTHQQNTHQEFSDIVNFCSTSDISPNGGLKRKRELEDETSKRMRPNLPCILPQSEEPLLYQLNRNIWNYFYENCQTDEIYDIKMALRNRLQKIIQSKFPSSDLFVFGSSMTGFATKTSDIDMCLMFHGFQIAKKKTLSVLWELRNLLRNISINRMEVIPAKVPILKFKDASSGFEVDLNINNPTGIRNSQLLRSYSRIDARLRPLILAVKFWARFHGINDAKSNTLSSYALGLMLIHYLQYRCHPPVLPSLQLLQPDKYIPDADVRSLRINEDLPFFRSENNQNVGQLFAGFLNYYSHEYDYENSRLSVRLGNVLPRVETQINKRKELRYWIDIEEPFEQTNVARSANNPTKSEYIKSVFDSSCQLVNQQETLHIL